MRRSTIFIVAAALATFTGCDQTQRISMTNPEPAPLRLTIPEAGYKLSPDDRANVLPIFDADALERLLQMVRPDMRNEILRSRRKRGARLRG